ncbi:MAG: 30S ribosomal protein S20 [Planctomycetaceae bacterium]|jgi:small subunit ribosomal protein S20|nr:30S ribosomal protein S20 [Planctomycetaceae bacterium]
MTHSKQAAKRVRTANLRRLKNRSVRTGIKSKIKNAVAAEPAKRAELLVESVSTIDKAAKAGVIHKNTAARRKSRLQKALNKLAAK